MIVNRANAEAAATLLEVDMLDMNDERVQAAYRTSARTAHPDGGGTPEAFAAVDRAKHVLLQWLKQDAAKAAPQGLENCATCGGSGIVRTQHGFAAPLRRTCPSCRGTGDANYDHDLTAGRV